LFFRTGSEVRTHISVLRQRFTDSTSTIYQLADKTMAEVEAPELYHPKVVFITGGAGFIASHVVIRLVTRYPTIKIVNFDKLDYCSCLRNLDAIADKPNYVFVKGDICNLEFVKFIFESEKVDTVMHFAAQSHVDNSFGNSIVFSESNVLGTHVLLEATRAVGKQITRFIHVSSDEVYGEIERDHPSVDESAQFHPTQPYSATKAAAELIVQAYQKSFNLPIIVTRGNNVYGPHQYPEKVVPKFINLLMRGKKLCIHGSGGSVRSFLFAEDVAEAFEIILFKGRTGDIYNIGTDFEMNMLQLAKELLRMFNINEKDTEMLEYVEDRAFNDCRYAITSNKLHDLGWKPRTPFDEGIKRTVEWYKKYNTNWGNVEAALAAHPRARPGLSSS